MGLHSSHVTRYTDSSVADFVCVNCGAHDEVPGGWGKLGVPCPKPVGSGGLTLEEWYSTAEKERIKEAEKYDSQVRSRT